MVTEAAEFASLCVVTIHLRMPRVTAIARRST
jgi:hypothetical protein